MNKIRIIGGTLRSRQIQVLDETQLRPTPNRIRETLFNWLREEIVGARCLDLFSGSGALGFEAISRGAHNVTFIEKDLKVIQQLKKNNENLGITNSELIQADALLWLKKSPPQPFDIIFLDPPYAEDLIAPCLALLISQNILTPRALIYIEHNQALSAIHIPAQLTFLQNKKAGSVYYGLLQFHAEWA